MTDYNKIAGGIIDTLTLRFHCFIDEDYIEGDWEKIIRQTPQGYSKRYVQTFRLSNGAAVMVTYYPNSFNRGPMFLVEFSLPHLIHGSNLSLLVDIPQAVDEANSMLATVPALPAIDLWEGVITRLDIFYNHHVGEFVPHYIKALGCMVYPHRKTVAYGCESVEFVSKHIKTKFYDKERESGDPAAHGILRQETTRRLRAVKKLTGKKRPALWDINADLLAQALEDDLADLKLLGRSIGTADTTLMALCEEFGQLEGLYYYAILHSTVQFGRDIVLSSTTLHPRSLQMRLKKIADAGIPLTLTEHTEPLPPLIIERTSLVEDRQIVDGQPEGEGLCTDADC